MNFFGIGTPEVLIIVLLLLLLFGPKELPEIARKIGGATKQMRDTLNSVNDEMTGMIETVKKIEDAQMIPPVTTNTTAPSANTPATISTPPTPSASALSAVTSETAPPSETAPAALSTLPDSADPLVSPTPAEED